jgi:hypothetical protein
MQGLMRGAIVLMAMTIAVTIAAVGCAKNPTTILVAVGADATVPPLLILRTSVVSTEDPTRTTGSDQTSPETGDASDRPGPFALPLLVPLTVDPSLAGPVVVTVQGLDWDTHAVIAVGSADAAVVGGHETNATVVLSAMGLPGADGGTDAGGDAGLDGP